MGVHGPIWTPSELSCYFAGPLTSAFSAVEVEAEGVARSPSPPRRSARTPMASIQATATIAGYRGQVRACTPLRPCAEGAPD